jgi:hypothetical protein
MPEYEAAPGAIKIIVSFKNEEDRADFAKKLGVTLTENQRSLWWPEKPKDDVSSVKFEDS